ncbi:ATP binding protein [Coelomomyces lativittatus]|nr:ATP binding protein [Coelomomyces lativittatus]
MGRYCQLVVGPAGSGKSTYCKTLLTHLLAMKRSGVRMFNFDPAADQFTYTPTVDIRDLIQLEEVTEQLGYGPNGGLIYCMDYVIQNLDWIDEQMDQEDDVYWLIDCPGQLELYTHFDHMKKWVQHLQCHGFHLCVVYCLETMFLMDPTKFFSGSLAAMSCMIQLELPHVNVITKMDLVKSQLSPSEYVKNNHDFFFF